MAIILIIGIEPILDMFGTAHSVTGNITTSTLISLLKKFTIQRPLNDFGLLKISDKIIAFIVSSGVKFKFIGEFDFC